MHQILVADDDRMNQVVVVGTLTKLGYAAEVVDRGSSAVLACAEDEYAAVLMDVMMPGMDGYTATRRIREHERQHGLPPVPIIGLSARAMPGDSQIALDAGMNDYLTKPIRTPALDAMLHRWIAARHGLVDPATSDELLVR